MRTSSSASRHFPPQAAARTMRTTRTRTNPLLRIWMISCLLSSLLLHKTDSLLVVVPDPVLHFSVGAVAGGAGAVAAYPFDFIKSQLQTPYGKQTYSNGLDAARQIFVAKGPLEFYKGVGVQVLGIAPEKGIKLGVNDVIAAACWSSGGCFPLWQQMLSGAVAGACQVVASSPLEVMKVGLQTSDQDIGQVWESIGGFKGLFKGAEACILRDVLFTAVCFPLYASWSSSGMNPFVAGAMSGVVASLVATPPDFVKTRILAQDSISLQQQQQQQQQANFEAVLPLEIPSTFSLFANGTLAGNAVVQGNFFFSSGKKSLPTTGDGSSLSEEPLFLQPDQQQQQRNPFVVASRIVQEEGVSVLFTGVSERCIGAIPRFGVTLALHDVLEQYMAQAGWLS